MPTGRKRIPTKLHIVKGTAQPCRINKREPKAPNEPPRAAIELRPKQAYWYGVIVGRLQAMGIASSADSEAVMLLAECFEDIEECNESIKEHGRVYVKYELVTLPSGEIKAQKMLRSNPAVGQRGDARRHAQSLLVEFGLTPASRGKVSVPEQGKGAAGNPWEMLVNG